MKPSLIVFSGGTMVHVTPHFSLCAPAYGKIGHQVVDALDALHDGFEVNHIQTKMAGGDVETNEDLAECLEQQLLNPNVKVIVMAAAICDFEPEELRSGNVELQEFGKSQVRLDSSKPVNIELKPADKLIARIKTKRPDITLVTFKTTSNETREVLAFKCLKQVEKVGSDFVFGNDIKTKENLIYTPSGRVFHGDRDCCIDTVVKLLMEKLDE